jgi:hypothetical protein
MHRLQPRRDPNRDRQYDGGDQAAPRLRAGVIILPLISACFVDIANAAAIGFMAR